MRVLMINHFPLEGSGSGTYTKNLAMELVKLGHEVCVICPEIDDDFPQYTGVRIHPVYFSDVNGTTYADDSLSFCFPCFTTHPESNISFGDLSDAQMCQYLASFSVAIDDEVKFFKPDVIHGQHVWALSSLAGGKGVPLVVTCHGTDLMGYDKWPYMKAFVDNTLEYASKIICISEDNEFLLKTMFPSCVSRIVRMRNGYNSDIFHIMTCSRDTVFDLYNISKSATNVILFAGKLTYFKGVDVLLDAFALYNQRVGDSVLIVAGDGEERESLFEQACRLGLDNVFFIGNVSQCDLARLYNVADISVVPSRREPFGLVAIEALACGTPVVATNQGGLPDFINGSVGCLVDVDDAEALTFGIEHTMARVRFDGGLRKFVSDYAFGSYSQTVIMNELVSVYESVM